MKRFILLLLLTVSLGGAYGQRTRNHTVYFNIQEFTGYVKFETFYKGFATRLHGRNAELVITGYNANKEVVEALNKGGLNLKFSSGNFSPEKFQVEITK